MALPITSHPRPAAPTLPRYVLAEMQDRSLSLWQVSALDELRDGPLHYIRSKRGYGTGWGRLDGLNRHNDMVIGSLLVRGLAVLTEDYAGRPIIAATAKGLTRLRSGGGEA